MRKFDPKYYPVLIYLVEKNDCYVHPAVTGCISGVTAWDWSSIQFSCYLDANAYAKKINGKVIKLRVYAVEEKFAKQSS
jgi:hypothetical protein